MSIQRTTQNLPIQDKEPRTEKSTNNPFFDAIKQNCCEAKIQYLFDLYYGSYPDIPQKDLAAYHQAREMQVLRRALNNIEESSSTIPPKN